MSRVELTNRVRSHREGLGLSQQELADLVRVSRQAIVGIERGRQVPSTALSLRLARTLRCGVEDLFTLPVTQGRLAVRFAPRRSPAAGSPGGRVVVGDVRGSWVAHPLPADGTDAADGIVRPGDVDRRGFVEPLKDLSALRGNVLVTGCAPVLGMLARRAGTRFANSAATWLPGSSRRSLELLEDGLVHVGGIHLSGVMAAADHESLIRARFPRESMLIVNLTRWREGFVVPGGNPLGIRTAEDLVRPGIRFARREDGAGARALVEGLLASAGVDAALVGPEATGHAEVALLVRSGAADVGVAIEGVARAAGLDFVPLAEERFDLVVPASIAETGPVSRFLHTLDDPSFRAEMAHLPGYDISLCGHVTTVAAA